MVRIAANAFNNVLFIKIKLIYHPLDDKQAFIQLIWEVVLERAILEIVEFETETFMKCLDNG